MIEDLQNASKLLSDALDQYVTACSTIATRSSCGPSHTFESISQEISDTVHKEPDLIASYHTKLAHAQVMVNRTMNNIPTLTPIHILPHDILSYIFRLVRDSQPDYLDKDSNPLPVAYPETLLFVCSRWHQIAMNSHALWSHIQISSSRCTYSNHPRLLARAKVFAARADPSPVDIHIIGGTHDCYHDNGLKEFCASVASRIRSFAMDLGAASFPGLHISTFQNWLANCRPGALNELVLKGSTDGNSYGTIEASENPIDPNSHLLELPHEYLEDRLRLVSVLQLTGFYFPWPSQAYHGLVELRLIPICEGANITITQSRLKTILTASPRLRELHFGLQIIDTLSNGSCVTVNLDELEVVNLCSMKWPGHYGPLLQLLAPGPRPLQLSINNRLASTPTFPGIDAIEFFIRSNVTKLHIESFDPEDTGRYQPLVLLELLKHVPTLRALSLRCIYLGPNQTSGGGQSQDREPLSHVDGAELRSPPQLDIVHLRDCIADLDYLRRVIRVVPIQKLKYRGCRFNSMADGYSREFEDPQPQDNLPSTFSYVSSSWALKESNPWA